LLNSTSVTPREGQRHEPFEKEIILVLNDTYLTLKDGEKCRFSVNEILRSSAST
jgi:hypothetical protein